MSKLLTKPELKWSTIEKEAYAIVFAIIKFKDLLRDIPFVLRTDHKNLTYMRDSISKRVQRWRTSLMEYNFTVEHIPGIKNVAADAFSRLIHIPRVRRNS
jgi:hypothetical protein